MLENFKKHMKLIAPLTEEDCSYFEKALTVKKLARNELLVREGQICRDICFIHSGFIRMYYLREGKEVNTYFFFENEFATSFQSFLHNEPSRYYLQAMEEAEVISFSYNTLEKAYEASHNWERIGRKLAEACYSTSCQRTESFLFLTGEQRYLDLMERKPEYFERIPLYHIASYLGIERESLSRLRKKISNAE